jgi:hypothetical protein
MPHPTKYTAPFSIQKAVLGVALLCAALCLSLGFSTPAAAQEEVVPCPNINWYGADSQTLYFWRDNLWCYIGHDEPAVQFYSSTPGSASNMTWRLVLPTEGTTPTFEDYIHFQVTMALCDPNSTAQNRVGACTPNSDSNIASGPNYSGAAFLEMKFIPPGEPLPSVFGYSCTNISTTKWCAIAQVQVESPCAQANPAVVNIGFITIDGNPPQPVYSNFPTPGNNTFFMDPGDTIRVVLTDSANGLLIVVVDETTHTQGSILLSSQNGFMSLTPPSPAPSPNCTAVPFNFRPLWNTATPDHIVPWALPNANVQFALETGHFEIQNSDGDDPFPCGTPTTNPVISSACFVTDNDFDGQPYQAGSWPPTTGGHSVQISSISGTGIGPSTSHQLYPQLQFETSFRATLGSIGTMASLIGKHVGNNTNFFYPYYTQLKPGLTSSITCELVIGNYVSGSNVANNFGQQGQYDGGTSNPGENAGPIMANPCQAFFAGTPGAANCHGQSVSELSQLYGDDMSNAASALGFSSVKDLQNAIRAFCG